MISLFKAWFVDPVALLFVLSLVVLYLVTRALRKRQNRRSRRVSYNSRLPLSVVVASSVWVGAYLFCSAPLIVNPLIALLEDPYLQEPACSVGSHMILLGGGVDSSIADVRDFERMSPATLSRSMAAIRMLLNEPETRLIVAGGAVGQIAEANVIAAYVEQMGVSAQGIIRESDSSTTRENALNVAALLDDEPVTGAVRLVTSAMHMPRALNTFRSALNGSGIEICPVSVDVQARKNVPFFALMPQSTAIARFDLLLHEAVALLVYRIKGWL